MDKGGLTSREWEVASSVLTHINEEATGSGDLLEFALRARGTAQVIETADHFPHRSHCDHACVLAETSVGPVAVVDVGTKGPVEADFIGVGENERIAVSADLGGVSGEIVKRGEMELRRRRIRNRRG